MYWSLENVPWTNLHDLNLDWIVNTMKQTVEQWIAYRAEMDQKYEDFTTQVNEDFDAFTAQINEWRTQVDSDFADLQQYVQDYFDNLDLNDSVRYVINQMIASGEFIQVLNPSIVSATEAWLASHVTPTSPVVDDTLSISGAAADAKATGNKISNLQSDLSNLQSNFGDIISLSRIDIQTIWEQGSLNGVIETASDIRIRTKYIDISGFTKIGFYVDSGYIYSLYTYDANGAVVDEISWSANSANVVPGTGAVKMRVLLCKSGNVNIVPSEGIHLTMRAYYALYNVVDDLNSNAFKYGGYVNSSTLDSLLPDANNAAANSFYVLRFTESDGTNIPAHLPFTQVKNGITDLLTLVTYNSPVYYMQFLYDRIGAMYTRFGANGNFSPWYSKTSDYTIHVGPGYQWTKLTDAIKFAYDNPNTTVIVHPAVYDIVAEMGNDYWTNFSGYADLTHAKIGNGAHFIFSPDARVVCQYTGSNTTVNTMYSPLNSLQGSEGDFTIEGLNLIVSGCRYAIHDDVGASAVEQTHRYINCDITNDKRCIGAGLGADMTVEMRDCVFRSSAEYTGNNPISWHNSGGGTTGKSSIIMTGCYITGLGNNTAQFLYHGVSIKKTRVLVSNNSMSANIYVGPADPEDTTNNIELLAWNNEIRE